MSRELEVSDSNSHAGRKKEEESEARPEGPDSEEEAQKAEVVCDHALTSPNVVAIMAPGQTRHVCKTCRQDVTPKEEIADAD